MNTEQVGSSLISVPSKRRVFAPAPIPVIMIQDHTYGLLVKLTITIEVISFGQWNWWKRLIKFERWATVLCLKQPTPKSLMNSDMQIFSVNFKILKTVSTSLNSQNLLSYHWEYFQVNPVEFIKARPCTTGCKSFEKLAKSNVVKTIWAVKHNALFSNSLGQVLGCFSFPCSSRALWGSTKVKMKSTK